MNIQPVSQNRQSGYANKSVNFCSTINPNTVSEHVQAHLRNVYHSAYWLGKMHQIEPTENAFAFGVEDVSKLFGKLGEGLEDSAIIKGIDRIIRIMTQVSASAFEAGSKGKISEGYKEAARARISIADVLEQDGPKVAAELRKAPNDNLLPEY